MVFMALQISKPYYLVRDVVMVVEGKYFCLIR